MQIFKFTLLLIFFLTLFGISQAKMYKWIDENGKVSYTNVAPPSTAKNIETSKEVIENTEEKIIRIHNERLARDEEAALKQYQKRQRQLMQAEQRRRDVEASRVQYTSPPKRVGLTAAQQKMLNDMAKRKFTAPGFSGSAKKARIHTQEVRNQRAIDELRAQFLGATAKRDNSRSQSYSGKQGLTYEDGENDAWLGKPQKSFGGAYAWGYEDEEDREAKNH
jgi:hypothetical protein